jgi:hypothetical protein
MQKGIQMDPLKPEKGEKCVGPESGTTYEWDVGKWVVISVKDSSIEKR